MQPTQGLKLAAFKFQSGLGRRYGQHLQAHLCQQSQSAHRPHHQARNVVSRHVFHDLAAKGQRLPAAVDELETQHKVAYGARAGARRTAQATGDHAANGGSAANAGAKMRWFKRQALTLRRQQRFEFNQRSTGTCGHDQFARLVAVHTRQRRRVEQLAMCDVSVKILAAAAANAQRGTVSRRTAHALCHGGNHLGSCINVCNHNLDSKRLRTDGF